MEILVHHHHHQKKSISEHHPLLSNIKEISFLLLLYTIQGTPMGMAQAINFLLQGHVNYKTLAIFSLVSLPFSLKVLWAPFVDSFYLKRLGRRKSWLLPIQILAGLLMYFGASSSRLESWLGSAHEGGSHHPPRTMPIFLFLTFLYILMATQDIVVDGWSLTLLHRRNIGWSSACNSIGQLLGFSLSNDLFLALINPQVANRWIRTTPSDDPLITISSFLRFLSYATFFSTILACFFHEPDIANIEKECHSGFKTYRQLISLLFFPPIQLLSCILLTCRIPFGTIDATHSLKLVNLGVKKEELTSMGPFLLPLKFLSPLLIGWLILYVSPLSLFLLGWIFRFLMNFFWLIIFFSGHLPSSRNHSDGTTAVWFYSLVLAGIALHNFFSDVMFSSQITFFVQISDPIIGGTYMTFLNTVGNIGMKWPSSVALLLLDYTETAWGKFGYYIQIAIGAFFGLLWFRWVYPQFQKIKDYGHTTWLLSSY